MANPEKNVLLQALVEGAVHDLMPRTAAGNVKLSDGSSAEAKIAELVEAVNLRAKSADLADVLRGRWYGKKWAAFGTSITFRASNPGSNPDGTAYDYHGGYLQGVKDLLGLGGFVNHGASGNPMVGWYPGREGILKKITDADLTGVDLVTIECGANDYVLDVPLGTPVRVDALCQDTNTFCGALQQAIFYLQHNYPNIRVALITSPQASGQRQDGAFDWDIHTANAAGRKPIDYVNAILAIGSLYSLPVVDLYRCGGLNPQNLERLTEDGHHPNEAGYARIAERVATVLEGRYSGSRRAFPDPGLLFMDGAFFDAGVARGFAYKMAVKSGSTYYLYFSNAPLFLAENADGTLPEVLYYEAGSQNNCYLSEAGAYRVFGAAVEKAPADTTEERVPGTNYYQGKRGRAPSAFVYANTDILRYGSHDILVRASRAGEAGL